MVMDGIVAHNDGEIFLVLFIRVRVGPVGGEEDVISQLRDQQRHLPGLQMEERRFVGDGP